MTVSLTYMVSWQESLATIVEVLVDVLIVGTAAKGWLLAVDRVSTKLVWVGLPSCIWITIYHLYLESCSKTLITP